MINVCHIVNLITGKADGVYTHLKMIFTLSDKERFQHYLIFQGGEKIEKELSEMGIKVLVSNSLKKKISIKAFKDIYMFIKKNDISIIHTHLIKPYAIAGLLNIFLRKKFIFNYHGLFLSNNIYYGAFEKIVYRLIHFIINLLGTVNAVLVPSRRSKELLMKETHLFPVPTVYYNGYNIQSNNSQNSSVVEKIQEIKKGGIIIAMVARLQIQKRIDRAIDIFKTIHLLKKNIFLLIFGDGELKQKLIEQAKVSGIESKIIFFDYVTNLISYYSYFDILLFTSEWEGTPLSMFEAMANKVPMVAPDVGGFKEIIEENNCGIIYAPGNMRDAEEKLSKLIEDNNLRKELGESGRMAVEKKYNAHNFIRQIENVYLNLYK